MTSDPIFQPLRFRHLTVKNRIFRSSMAGKLDNYDGSGTDTRINWELKFARNGVGTIISSFVPVHEHGRIIPNFATIIHPDAVAYWRKLGKYVHQHDCKFILQLSHSGRQRDLKGIHYPKGLSSTDKADSLHGFECERMTVAQIKEVVTAFAEGAARAREAGLDGVEIHGAHGYLVTQFLSSAINDRKDEYGGSLENRYRFLGELVAAIRDKVGSDYHFQVKFNAEDFGRAVIPWEKKGNDLKEGIQVAQWLEAGGVDALHVSSGDMFPHPRTPPGRFPVDTAARTYDAVASEGKHTFRNYVIFRTWPLSVLFKWWWQRTAGKGPDDWEGINLPAARAIKAAVGIPVLVTGGWQRASKIREALASGCDGVTIARPLIANNDLVRHWEAGLDQPPEPCTYCNKCLVELLQNPLGCYEESRFKDRGGREEMIKEIMSVFAHGDLPDEPTAAAEAAINQRVE